jgi:hypothetical protein
LILKSTRRLHPTHHNYKIQKNPLKISFRFFTK